MRAATSMFLISFAKSLPRLASIAAFLCLVVAHLEWPLIPYFLQVGCTGSDRRGRRRPGGGIEPRANRTDNSSSLMDAVRTAFSPAPQSETTYASGKKAPLMYFGDAYAKPLSPHAVPQLLRTMKCPLGR